MEKHASGSASLTAAREQLGAARELHDASVRRAMTPAGLILAVSFLCGALTLTPAVGGSARLVSIIAVVWFLAELVRLSARNHWQALRLRPRPRWNLIEAVLMGVAVLVGGVVGPHLLASRSNAPLVSWGLAGAVTVTVATLLLAANASFKHRASRAWPQ
jgi:hypothetical protein